MGHLNAENNILLVEVIKLKQLVHPNERAPIKGGYA